MSDNETHNADEATQSRPRRDRKDRQAAKKDESSESATAVATADTTNADTAEETRNRKSTETTYQKQQYILDLLTEKGEMSINRLMEATYEQFGTRVAFDKAKEAKAAWQNGTEIKKRDGRRDRRGRNMRRHDSQMTLVVLVEKGEIKASHMCADDQEAIQQATKLATEGIPTENIHIYVRYSASAEVSFN